MSILRPAKYSPPRLLFLIMFTSSWAIRQLFETSLPGMKALWNGYTNWCMIGFNLLINQDPWYHLIDYVAQTYGPEETRLIRLIHLWDQANKRWVTFPKKESIIKEVIHCCYNVMTYYIPILLKEQSRDTIRSWSYSSPHLEDSIRSFLAHSVEHARLHSVGWIT